MDQVKLVIQFHQRFGGSKKEVTSVIQVVEEVIDDFRLRRSIEVDQNVAAEDQIHSLHEEHFGIVLEIEPADDDELLDFRPHLQPLLIERNEVFALEVVGGTPQRVIAVDAGLGGFHRAVIQIGGQNFDGPALQQTF